jgi:hypothetical protein
MTAVRMTVSALDARSLKVGKHKVNLMRKVGDYRMIKADGLYEIRKKTRRLFVSLHFISANTIFNEILAKEAANGDGNPV